MGRLDALFLHAPRFDGDRREVMVMPLGVPALANLLLDDGRTVEILHLGIEPEVDASFSLRRAVREREPRVILVSLHFNPQTRAAIDAARAARAYAPEAKIVMGGLTATVFAHELVALGLADVVVRGDGEEPLRALMRVLLDGEGALAAVPNLTYRDGNEVRVSSGRWSLDVATAGKLRHGDLRALRHREAYVARSLYADFSEGSKGSEGYPFAAYVNAGRGCTADCACCGGAAGTQDLLSGRHGILAYPIEKLARDVADAVDAGARVLRSCFDPPEARRHVLDWFARLRADGLGPRAIWDLWAPAPRAFLEELARTFAAGSLAVYSPDAGSEAVRRRIRGYAYSNEQLLGSIREAEARGLDTHCFFAVGLPSETQADVEETARLVARIRRETRAAISVTPMFVDPGSPLSREPSRWSARLIRRSLRDYYEERGVRGGPGFETEHFSEQQAIDACKRVLEAT